MKPVLVRYPVVWITCGVLVLVAISTLRPFDAALILTLCPVLLILEWLIRAIANRHGVRLWVRRTCMLVPVFLVSTMLFKDCNGFGGRQRALVRHTLAGRLPSQISDLRVHHDAWTDEVIVAYFRCEPQSLKNILESPPFGETERPSGPLSKLPFEGWHLDNSIPQTIVYSRTDLPKNAAWCRVTTDPTFSFAFIEFAAD